MRAIERVDAEVLAPILRVAPAAVLVLPTITRRSRCARTPAAPVPFVISEPLPGSGGGGAMSFGEGEAAATGLVVDDGAALMRLFLEATG